MTDNDLRIHLANLAADEHPVDLYDRALNRSRQIGRRRVALATASVAAAVALLAGAATVLVPRLSAAPIPPAASTPPATLTPSPSPVTPSPAPVVTPPAAAPIGLTFTGTLPVPPWLNNVGCPDGQVAFANGTGPGPGNEEVVIQYVTTGDLGGSPAWVVRLNCYGSRAGGFAQVAAYRSTGGDPVLLGKLADIPTVVDGIAVDISSVVIANDEVEMTIRLDTAPSWLPTSAGKITQVRRYALQGTKLVQTSGAGAIKAKTADAALTVTTGNLVFAPAQDGCRKGTLTYTVSNAGPKAVADLTVAVFAPVFDDSKYCPASPGVTDRGIIAPPISLSAHESRTVTLTVYESVKRTGPVGPQIVQPSGYNYIELHVSGGMVYPTKTPITLEYQ